MQNNKTAKLQATLTMQKIQTAKFHLQYSLRKCLTTGSFNTENSNHNLNTSHVIFFLTERLIREKKDAVMNAEI